MARYSLSREAARDLEEIYTWGASRFGMEQAERYAASLCERIEEIAQFPERWPLVPEILLGCRRSVAGSHAVYYEVEESGEVFVLRILGRQDVMGALS